MRVRPDARQQLTYCLNIHRGESWAESFAALRGPALSVARRVAADQPLWPGPAPERARRGGADGTGTAGRPARISGPAEPVCLHHQWFSLRSLSRRAGENAGVRAGLGRALERGTTPVCWLTCWPVFCRRGRTAASAPCPWVLRRTCPTRPARRRGGTVARIPCGISRSWRRRRAGKFIWAWSRNHPATWNQRGVRRLLSACWPPRAGEEVSGAASSRGMFRHLPRRPGL
jgi:hypothetical protein